MIGDLTTASSMSSAPASSSRAAGQGGALTIEQGIEPGKARQDIVERILFGIHAVLDEAHAQVFVNGQIRENRTALWHVAHADARPPKGGN